MWRIRVVVSLFLIPVSGVFADGPVVKNSFVRDTILSPDWSCEYLEKRILDVPADGSLDSVGPLCKASVKCVAIRGPEKNSIAKTVLTCKTVSHNACPDLKTCALEQESETKEFDTENAPVASVAKNNGPDKFGRTCQYKDPKFSAVTFWKKGGKKLGHTCNNRVKCTSSKGPSEPVISCPATVTVNSASGIDDVSCPQYYDCAANDKSRPGYTEAEIEDLKRRGHTVTASSGTQHK
jgi:hypothetical protein